MTGVPEGLQALSEAATPGPWEDVGMWWRDGHDGITPTRDPHPTVSAGLGVVVAEPWRLDRSDAAFIVAAVNHVRDLLASPSPAPQADADAPAGGDT